jgi:hypothetical protein
MTVGLGVLTDRSGTPIGMRMDGCSSSNGARHSHRDTQAAELECHIERAQLRTFFFPFTQSTE